MYVVSKFSNKIKNIETNDIFLQDNREPLYRYYLEYLVNNGYVELVEFFNDEIDIVKQNKSLNNEKQKYIQRVKDGQEKYAELSAEFRLAKLSGQISEETHSAIEEILIPVRNEVLAGQWMSALTKLEGIGSVLIGASLYNRLHNDIQTYINNSYTVEEILNRRG